LLLLGGRSFAMHRWGKRIEKAIVAQDRAFAELCISIGKVQITFDRQELSPLMRERYVTRFRLRAELDYLDFATQDVLSHLDYPKLYVSAETLDPAACVYNELFARAFYGSILAEHLFNDGEVAARVSCRVR